jgi:hypothetical protein
VLRTISGMTFDIMSNNISEEWSGRLFYARIGRGWCERGR